MDGASQDLQDGCWLFKPRRYEQPCRPREVWKLDLHTSSFMRNDLKMVMEADEASSAMIFWLQALRPLGVFDNSAMLHYLHEAARASKHLQIYSVLFLTDLISTADD